MKSGKPTASSSRPSVQLKEERVGTLYYTEACYNLCPPRAYVDWRSSSPPPFVIITNVGVCFLKFLVLLHYAEDIVDVSESYVQMSFLQKRLRDRMNEEPQDMEDVQEISPWLMDNPQIETVRKENLFGTEVTESEQHIIEQRVALQQRQYAEFERREYERKSHKIRAVFDFVVDSEIKMALADCENEEDEVIVHLTNPSYLHGIRKKLAQNVVSNIAHTLSDEQKEAYEQLLKKRKETLKKTTGETAKKQYRMKGRLALDDALKQVQENKKDLEKAFQGWSEARIKAYKAIDTKPNTYYYRFNAPGEEQRKGQWTKEEEELFFKRLEEIGADGQWGIFSMAIPGRVGYQCSNFYRLLIETGRIKDPNYVLDEKGKAHYLFSTKNKETGETVRTFRKHMKHGSGGIRKAAATASSSRSMPLTKRKRRKSHFGSDDEEDDDYDFDDSGTFSMKTTWATTKRTRIQVQGSLSIETDGDKHTADDNNPLPGFVDPITLEEVVNPAISKYGHVMGYESWVRCLSSEATKNTCPLTKKPLTKRELTLLTLDNIEEYRHRIVNLN